MEATQAISSTPPFRVKVKELKSSRYEDGLRPLSWDARYEGHDRILTQEGVELTLLSDGQQSPPQPGWELLVTGGSQSDGYTWTLYGVPSGSRQ